MTRRSAKSREVSHDHYLLEVRRAEQVERSPSNTMVITSDIRCLPLMNCVVVRLSFLLVLVAGDRHLNSNGPFGKRHTIGNEPSPFACNRGAGLTFPSTTERRFHKNVVQDLHVSQTTYMSNEQIQVTWTPISLSCKDDFIGIYSSNISLLSGVSLSLCIL